MEQNIISTELEQMREQITLLKDKLSQQSIINQQHILRAIKGGVSTISRMRTITIIAGLFACVYCPVVFYRIGHSSLFISVSLLLLIVCIIATLWIHRGVSPKEVSKDNLVELGIKVQGLKRQYLNWLLYSIPTLLLWLGWFVYEGYTVLPLGNPQLIVVAGLVGALVGAIFGVLRYRKFIREVNQILNHINDLQAH